MLTVRYCEECGARLPLVRIASNWRQAIWGGWTCPQCRSELDRWGRRIGAGPGPRRTHTLDDSTFASDPGGLAVSHEKLRDLRPDLYGFAARLGETFGLAFPQRRYIEEQLKNGDSRAAVVVSVAPLLVAAYTDELDCVALLAFDEAFVTEYDLKVGTRLLTVNTYGRKPDDDADLTPGPGCGDRYTGFHPIIAEFVSDDWERIEQRKRAIPDDEWRRAFRMGTAYLTQRPGVSRDGRPVFSGEPARVRRRT